MKNAPKPRRIPNRNRPGRSSELIHIRNINLVKRYYYWSEIKRLRLDDVLEILSKKEFFISEQTIWNIIKKNHEMISRLRNGELAELGDSVQNKNQLTLFDK